MNKPPASTACLPAVCRSRSSGGHGQGRAARSQGGIWPFTGVPSQPLRAQRAELWEPGVPPCPSWLSAPSPCLSFPAGGCVGSAMADHCRILVGTWGRVRRWGSSPRAGSRLAGCNTRRTRHRPPPTAPLQNEPRQPWWHQDVYSPMRAQPPHTREGHRREDHAGGVQPARGQAEHGRGVGGMWRQDRDSGALPWAGARVWSLTRSLSWRSSSGCSSSPPCTSWGRGPAGTGVPSSTGGPRQRAGGHWRPNQCRGQPPAPS